MEIVRHVIYPLDPALPLGELVQLVKYEQRIIRAPPFSKNILTVFVKIPVKITPIRVTTVEDGLCKSCFTHLPGTSYENHFSFQVIQNMGYYIAHMSILPIIPKQSRLFWIQGTEIKNPTGILNESDGGIYITAQLLADAELWYGPKVFYSYSVAGQNYENVTLSFKQDSHTQSKEYAESIIAKYPREVR